MEILEWPAATHKTVVESQRRFVHDLMEVGIGPAAGLFAENLGLHVERMDSITERAKR